MPASAVARPVVADVTACRSLAIFAAAWEALWLSVETDSASVAHGPELDPPPAGGRRGALAGVVAPAVDRELRAVRRQARVRPVERARVGRGGLLSGLQLRLSRGRGLLCLRQVRRRGPRRHHDHRRIGVAEGCAHLRLLRQRLPPHGLQCRRKRVVSGPSRGRIAAAAERAGREHDHDHCDDDCNREEPDQRPPRRPCAWRPWNAGRRRDQRVLSSRHGRTLAFRDSWSSQQTCPL